MSRQKVLALLVAAIMAAGALAPRPAYGGLSNEALALSLEPGHRAAETVAKKAEAETAREAGAETTGAETVVPAAPDSPAPKGNAFVRVITAPFRALGRLFGGGRKSASASKKREEKPAGTKQAEAQQAEINQAGANQSDPAKVEPAVAAGVVEREAAASDIPAPPGPTRAPEVRTDAQGRVQIIRPDEQPAARPQPKAWIPIIEGIGRDPLTQGRALLEQGYLNEAVSELSIAAAGTENLAEANNLLGLAYDRLGDHRQAAESYERALLAAPQDPVLLANLGYSLYLSNDFGGAFKRLRQAARLAPHLPVVHNHLGIVQARLGKYEDAFKSFARATGEYDAHLRVASILDFERRDKQAIKHYEAALRLQPNTSAVLERLVALYERTGERTKADLARRALGQPRNDQRTTTGGG